MGFERQTVVVTGGSRGLGRATVLAFARQGADIAFSFFQDLIAAERLISEVRAMGRRCIGVRCDMGDESAVVDFVSACVQTFRSIDVLINNAAIVADAPVLARTSKQWRRTFDVNLLGAFVCTKEFAPGMIERGKGAVVNVASISGTSVHCPEIIDYDATKAAIISMTKNFSKAFAPHGVRVNALAPGWIDTEMNSSLAPEYASAECARISLKRFASPDEIAKPILFLAGPDASYISGSVLVVDGGRED